MRNIHGSPFHQTITAPAPGADFLYLLPQQFLYKLISLRFTLITDTTVANRLIAIQLTDVGAVLHAAETPVAQPASSTRTYFCSPSASQQKNSDVAALQMNWPIDIPLRGNWSITSSTTNLQPGDQFTAIEITLERWATRTV